MKKGETLDVLNYITATNTVGKSTEYVCVKRGGKWLWCASKLLG